MDRVGVLWYLDPAAGQLFTESYRPRSGGQNGRRALCKSRRQVGGRADQRPPNLFSVGVEGGEDFAAPSVEHGKAIGIRGRALGYPALKRIEGSHSDGRQAERRRKRLAGR